MYKLINVFAIGFFLFIIWIIYLANTGQNSVFFEFIREIPYGDKIGHFGLFGLLTLLFNLALKCKSLTLGKVNIYWGTLGVFVFVTLEELSQHFMATRTLDQYDYLANIVGISAFTWFSSLIAKSDT